MDKEVIKSLLEDVQEGSCSIDDALQKLKKFPFDDLGFAKLDSHRSLRQGTPEVIFCEGKTIEQVVLIVKRLTQYHKVVIGTRANQETADAVLKEVPEAVYEKSSRIIRIGKPEVDPDAKGFILVITAGTSDIPVAEEAAVVAEAMGSPVQRIFDAGVSGIHRLFDKIDIIQQAEAVVVVAGMEGALPSIVGGLVDKPVIAVPTSVGYGASFNGLSALLTMLNTCAPGVVTVNIDNGFGAGYFAAMLNRK